MFPAQSMPSTALVPIRSIAADGAIVTDRRAVIVLELPDVDSRDELGFGGLIDGLSVDEPIQILREGDRVHVVVGAPCARVIGRSKTRSGGLLGRRAAGLLSRVEARSARGRGDAPAPTYRSSEALAEVRRRAAALVEEFDGLGMCARALTRDETVDRLRHGFGMEPAGPIMSRPYSTASSESGDRHSSKDGERPMIGSGMGSAGPVTGEDVVALIAPDFAVFHEDRAVVSGRHMRTLYVEGWPDAVRSGWLDPVYESASAVSVFIQPVPLRPVVDRLRQSIAEDDARPIARSGVPRARRIARVEGWRLLLAELEAERTRPYQVAVHLLVTGDDVAELDRRTRDLERIVDSAGARSRRAALGQHDGLRSMLPLLDNPLASMHSTRMLETETTRTLYPFVVDGRERPLPF